MRIVRDKDGEKFLEFEIKENLNKFRRFLIELYLKILI